ncbi:MAG: DUF1592 domain-containing protein [Myxococcota bacterium]
MKFRIPKLATLLSALAGLGGCYQGLNATPGGEQGAGPADGGDNESPDPVSSEDEVAPLPVRRLTRSELLFSLRDLLGAPFEPEATLPTDAQGLHGFEEGGLIATVDARNLMNVAEEFGEAVTTSTGQLVACDPSAAACVESFIETFGRRVYRRHLEPDERAELLALYEYTRTAAELSPEQGLGAIAEAMVQSPHFLYRRELGAQAPQAVDGVIVLAPDEVASRLSYLLWSSIPDDELFAAADAEQLQTAEQLEAQARRMLDDPRADRVFDDFHLQWLDLRGTSTQIKDTNVFPQATPELMASMEEETRRFVRWVLRGDGEGTLGQLLTASFSVIDDRLAALYGVEAPVVPFSPVELDPSQRIGLLTQPAFLASHAGTALTNPAARGKLLSERLLCRALPPPPDDVPELEPPAPGSTTREQFEEHSKNPACRGCHETIDPLGFSLEHYDAIGGFREQEFGEPVDASGTLTLDDSTLTFSSMVELAPRLATSPTVQRCVATQWFRYAIGRAELPADEGSREAIFAAFEDSDFDIRELMVAIVSSPTFRERAPNPGEEIR